jgi:hypothetical protein
MSGKSYFNTDVLDELFDGWIEDVQQLAIEQQEYEDEWYAEQAEVDNDETGAEVPTLNDILGLI